MIIRERGREEAVLPAKEEEMLQHNKSGIDRAREGTGSCEGHSMPGQHNPRQMRAVKVPFLNWTMVPV